jgi:hypothetical protein
MLRSGNTLRLTPRERARLEALTGVRCGQIDTVAALNRHVELAQIAHRQSTSGSGTPEGRLLAALLDDEKITD